MDAQQLERCQFVGAGLLTVDVSIGGNQLALGDSRLADCIGIQAWNCHWYVARSSRWTNWSNGRAMLGGLVQIDNAQGGFVPLAFASGLYGRCSCNTHLRQRSRNTMALYGPNVDMTGKYRIGCILGHMREFHMKNNRCHPTGFAV